MSRAEVMKGVSPPKMQLIGTASAVEQAKLWLQCHTDYLNEMAEQEVCSHTASTVDRSLLFVAG